MGLDNSFDCAAIRKQIEKKAGENGYSFTYKLTGAGSRLRRT